MIPAIEDEYKSRQKTLLEELKKQTEVPENCEQNGSVGIDLSGDGTYDSPGFSAKYLTYVLIHGAKNRESS